MSKDRLAQVLKDWEAVIGLEIHTELTSLASKMFCGCPVEFGGEPNTRVCPVCLGLPGSLPVPNQAAIEATILCGLALDCKIAPFSQFHRKNYFYPDMPKNYQISQYDLPFCVDGHLDVEVGDGDSAYTTRIGITRIHLEEDTGKMIHVGGGEGRIAGATHSLVDFNRAGTALMELVTEPDIRTPEEARRFAQELRRVFRALGVSDCSMEEGSMRVDANVSVRRRGSEELGTKTEIKNVNSFKSLHDALAYEIVRQAEEIDAGRDVVQETRHWDAAEKRTSVLRTKEEAHDYRYFPEPDMVPFVFSEEFIEGIRARLPELPAARKTRFIEEYGLPGSDAGLLAAENETAAFFESAVACAPEGAAKQVANWMLGDLAAWLNENNSDIAQSPVTPEALAELVSLLDEGAISGKQAKKVFAMMLESGEAPSVIVEREGMEQITDQGAIESMVDSVLSQYPEKVEEYRAGKKGLLGFFVGQVMRESGGSADPKAVSDTLTRKLEA
ncbi:MAG: Asp-tRNA(Asn)/Glu-tRNA(Gln) amidotransferase subunit GatB [Coriobacteriia bacterium]